MGDVSALAQLVGDPSAFLATTWGRRPLHLAASNTQRAGLLGLDDVDQLVATSGLRAPAFRLIKQGRTLPQASVTRRGARVGGKPVPDLIDVAKVHREVSNGATLVLQGLHRSFPPVTDFCRDLEATLHHPLQANAYLTPPVAQGLNLHEDPHDVFAVQTYGTKRWVVHPPDGAEPWDLQLSQGDVLYLPAGTKHAAQTVDTPSLHLTLGVRTITWRQLVQRSLEAASQSADLDQPLPAGWADDPTALEGELAARVRRVLQRLESQPDLGAVLEHRAEAFWSSRPADLRGGLRDLLELDHLDDHTPLRRRPLTTARLAEGAEGTIELRLADRRLSMPASLAQGLARILDADSLRPSDLSDLMDEQSRIVLTRRLVREGLLTIARADADSAARD